MPFFRSILIWNRFSKIIIWTISAPFCWICRDKTNRTERKINRRWAVIVRMRIMTSEQKWTWSVQSTRSIWKWTPQRYASGPIEIGRLATTSIGIDLTDNELCMFAQLERFFRIKNGDACANFQLIRFACYDFVSQFLLLCRCVRASTFNIFALIKFAHRKYFKLFKLFTKFYKRGGSHVCQLQLYSMCTIN